MKHLRTDLTPTAPTNLKHFLVEVQEPDNRPVEVQRRDLLAEEEREIMQNRIAKNVSEGKNRGVKHLTYSEKLKMRLDINKRLPGEKP